MPGFGLVKNAGGFAPFITPSSYRLSLLMIDMPKNLPRACPTS